jgi:CheY-like chemotaxis protein
VNLVVNARDALPQGGTITITTRSQTFDEADCRARLDVSPGAHVLLSVSDDGLGMPPEVKARAFEPFFTTKGPGKGTGLGLAMVYGAVKQAGGAIELDSEPGRGTTVTILLPRVSEAVEPGDAATSTQRGRAHETIILVEDDELVRAFAGRVLRQRGYLVRDFPDGPSALVALRSSADPAHLLVTDVVMPGMNGRILAQRLTELRPGLRVLYTSGYPKDALTPAGILEPGLDLLPKPYTPDALASSVRELLDKRATDGAGPRGT